MMFNGFRVLLSEWLVEEGQPFPEPRTWRERLFSLPWRPFKRTRWITPMVPSRTVRKVDRDTLLMHPAIWRELKEATSGGQEP